MLNQMKRKKTSPPFDSNEMNFLQDNAWNLKNAFERAFDILNFKDSNNAALYFLSLIACHNQSSLPAIQEYIKNFFNKGEISRTRLIQARNELVDKGIIAYNFTSESEPSFKHELGRFYPNDPSIIFETTLMGGQILKKDEYQKIFGIINEFSEKFYKKNFDLRNISLSERQLVIGFSSMWPVYFLLTYLSYSSLENKRDVSLLLNGIREEKSIKSDSELRPPDYYFKLFKNSNVKILLGKRDEKQKKLAELLISENNKVKVRFTKSESLGTTRRIILENVFAIDIMKIPQNPQIKRTNDNEGFSYIGALYFNENKNAISKSFNALWELSISLEE
jgi:hypothetical protein